MMPIEERRLRKQTDKLPIYDAAIKAAGLLRSPRIKQEQKQSVHSPSRKRFLFCGSRSLADLMLIRSPRSSKQIL
jgi:hypothetical protein